MIQIKGNKQIQLEKGHIKDFTREFEETIIDLGTGDGRFVFKSAMENPDKLFIGIDPAEKQLEIYSKKAQRKKLYNAMFLLGSLENLEIDEFDNISDKIFIHLPWGSLLKQMVDPQKEMVEKISKMMKTESNLEITLGYSFDTEPSETERLELPEINNALIKNVIEKRFMEYGNLELIHENPLEKAELASIETSWGKKLKFGNERPIFKLVFKKSE